MVAGGNSIISLKKAASCSSLKRRSIKIIRAVYEFNTADLVLFLVTAPSRPDTEAHAVTIVHREMHTWANVFEDVTAVVLMKKL